MVPSRWQDLELQGSSLDDPMQCSLQHESNVALRHQIEVERERKAQMERSDFFWTAGIVAGAFGFGLGTGALQIRGLSRIFGRRKK